MAPSHHDVVWAHRSSAPPRRSQIYDYRLDRVLRLGFFRIVSPVLKDGELPRVHDIDESVVSHAKLTLPAIVIEAPTAVNRPSPPPPRPRTPTLSGFVVMQALAVMGIAVGICSGLVALDEVGCSPPAALLDTAAANASPPPLTPTLAIAPATSATSHLHHHHASYAVPRRT